MTIEPVIDVGLERRPVMLLTRAHSAGAGAECSFLGITRPEEHPEHGELICLEYEAHETMAQQELRSIAEFAAERWSLLSVRLHHALGRVPVGQASVVIQVHSRHRAESFEACRWLIDELKSRVPIWKQECWERSSSWKSGVPLQTTPDSTDCQT